MSQILDQQTEDLLQKETDVFTKRTSESKRLFDRASKVATFGVHSNYRFNDPYPLYVIKGSGSRLWDTNGNEYLDFSMGFGALVSGHSHPKLVEAISQRIREGTLFGFEGSDAVPLAELMCSRFGVDKVKFSSVGAEGTMHAIRFARAYTRRSKIIKFEGCYHGSHDGLLVSIKPKADLSGPPERPIPVPASLGLPDNILKNTLIAPFNNLSAVEKILEENANDVAGIILEPIAMNMGFIQPVKGFLEGLRRLCDKYGCVLIFDEVKTCGKFYGGITERYGVSSDLKIFGKAIAGGYPLSAVGGRKEIMDIIVPGSVSHAGTFNSNPVSILAGLVTLRDILTEQNMYGAQKLGESLARGYKDIIESQNLDAHIQSDGISGALAFSKSPINNWRDFQMSDVGKWSIYYLMMLNRGVIPAGTGPDEQWTVSVQHTTDDINQHLEVFKEISSRVDSFKSTMPIVESI
jgi:glutamate-1-semialdehyde 2,1-aminomutase